MVEFTSKLKVPSLPNFIRLEGFNPDNAPAVDVADLSDEQIEQIGKEWTAALLDHKLKRLRNRDKI